ncbi:MAG: hypothetical protein ACLS37_12120 [Alistipes sp.]
MELTPTAHFLAVGRGDLEFLPFLVLFSRKHYGFSVSWYFGLLRRFMNFGDTEVSHG